jgi:hypothetical protein
MKNWRTTLFGAILGITMAMSQYGIKIGHVGQGDYLGLIQVAAAILLGGSAKDKNVTGGSIQQ